MGLEVLSLSRSITEIDRVEDHRPSDDQRRVLLGHYINVICAVSDHAIRADLAAVESYQKSIRELLQRLDGDPSPEVLAASPRQFAEAQKVFQQDTEKQVEELRSNLTMTSRMVKELMVQLTGIGTSHHESLQGDIESLRRLQMLDSLEKVRSGLGDMASRMSARLQQLQKEHQLTVVQLRDEIRTLHRQLEHREPPPAAPVPPAEPARVTIAPVVKPAPFQGLRRQEFENAIRSMAEDGETFCLSVIWMSNLGHLFTEHEPEVVLELMLAASLRLGNMLTSNKLWTRWDDDVFTVCLGVPKPDTRKASENLASRLDGTYRVNKGGQQAHVELEIRSTLLEHSAGDPYDRLIQKIAHFQRNV